MWTVIYMAQDREFVNQIRKLIADNNIITKMRALKKSDEDYCYEILVPATEICVAHSLILDAEL